MTNKVLEIMRMFNDLFDILISKSSMIPKTIQLICRKLFDLHSSHEKVKFALR